MTQDNSDDPFEPRDQTMMRPKPGAGRRPGTAPGAMGAPPPTGYQPAPAVPRTSAGPAGPARAASINEFMTTGLNPLVQAATPLLVLAGRLRGQVSQATSTRCAARPYRKFAPSRIGRAPPPCSPKTFWQPVMPYAPSLMRR